MEKEVWSYFCGCFSSKATASTILLWAQYVRARLSINVMALECSAPSIFRQIFHDHITRYLLLMIFDDCLYKVMNSETVVFSVLSDNRKGFQTQQSLREFKFCHGFVVQDRSGFIVGGRHSIQDSRFNSKNDKILPEVPAPQTWLLNTAAEP